MLEALLLQRSLFYSLQVRLVYVVQWQPWLSGKCAGLLSNASVFMCTSEPSIARDCDVLEHIKTTLVVYTDNLISCDFMFIFFVDKHYSSQISDRIFW